MLLLLFALAQYFGASQYFDGVREMGPWAWVDGNAASGICRALVNGEYHPGQFAAGKCSAGTDNVQLLVVPEAYASLFPQRWIAPNSAEVGFVAGFASGSPLRVCRAGALIGSESQGKCSVAPNGRYEVLSLYNGAKLKASVSKQSVEPVIIEVTTIVAFPGRFTPASLQPPWPAGTFSVTKIDVDNSYCPATPGSQCRQFFTAYVDPGKTNCRLDGNWTLVLTKSCVDGTACGSGAPAIDLPMRSENFCRN